MTGIQTSSAQTSMNPAMLIQQMRERMSGSREQSSTPANATETTASAATAQTSATSSAASRVNGGGGRMMPPPPPPRGGGGGPVADIATLQSKVESQLTSAVEGGRLTEDQATEIRAMLTSAAQQSRPGERTASPTGASGVNDGTTGQTATPAFDPAQFMAQDGMSGGMEGGGFFMGPPMGGPPMGGSGEPPPLRGEGMRATAGATAGATQASPTATTATTATTPATAGSAPMGPPPGPPPGKTGPMGNGGGGGNGAGMAHSATGTGQNRASVSDFLGRLLNGGQTATSQSGSSQSGSSQNRTDVSNTDVASFLRTMLNNEVVNVKV